MYSRKYPNPHYRGSLEVQIFISLNWNFQRGGGGGGFKPKKPSTGGVWIFSGTTHCVAVNDNENNVYLGRKLHSLIYREILP